jgi:hypothetical protein
VELAKWQLDFVKFWKSKNGNALLWCQTGLGKSVVASYLASRTKCVFVVVPPHLIPDWIEKLGDWGVTADRINIIKEKNVTFQSDKINIISVVKLAVEKKLKGLDSYIPNSLLIIDECHNIKNFKSNSFKKINKFRDIFEYSLLLSATFIGNDTVDYYAYSQIVNKNMRSLYGGSFEEFSHNNVEWENIRLGDGKVIPKPMRIIPRTLETHTYPFLFKMTYKEAGVVEPTHIFKNVYFDFDEKHNTALKNVKKVMNFDINGVSVNIDDISLEDFTMQELELLVDKMKTSHPTFYQLMNCVFYDKKIELYVDTPQDITDVLTKNMDVTGFITYSTPEQLKLLINMGFTDNRKNKIYYKFNEEVNLKMKLLLRKEVKYYDMDKKIDLLNSIVESNDGRKGFLTYYFEGEREVLSKLPYVYMYEKISDIEKFQKSNKSVLVSEVGQLGEGIRLKFCDYIVEFSLYYNLIDILQSRGRLGYAGRNDIVTIYSLMPSSKETDKITKIIKRKLDIHTTEFYKK